MAPDMNPKCKDCVHFNPVEYVCGETLIPTEEERKACLKFYSWEQCEKDNDL